MFRMPQSLFQVQRNLQLKPNVEKVDIPPLAPAQSGTAGKGIIEPAGVDVNCG